MNPNEIRAIRHRRKLNQAEFGVLIGVSGRTVEKYELGTVRPSRAVMMHIKRLGAQA